MSGRIRSTSAAMLSVSASVGSKPSTSRSVLKLGSANVMANPSIVCGLPFNDLSTKGESSETGIIIVEAMAVKQSF